MLFECSRNQQQFMFDKQTMSIWDLADFEDQVSSEGIDSSICMHAFMYVLMHLKSNELNFLPKTACVGNYVCMHVCKLIDIFSSRGFTRL